MKRFSFSTFQVDELNQEALQTCRAVAELQPVSPMPVLLLGDRGCGKTHLLYSIVNHVRAASEVTGLACVTAREFPERVLQIIKDPTPVERARSAILLVDQLESFSDKLDELDAVVRIFLDHGHYVVIASNVHPARLKSLSAEFRALIEEGQILHIRPRMQDKPDVTPPPQENSTMSPGNRAMEELARRQQELILQLRTEIETARGGPTAVEEVAEMHRMLDAEQRRAVELTRQLETERKEHEALDARMRKADAEIATLRREIEESHNAFSSISDVRQEIARLNQQMDQLKAEREAGERERSLLVTELAQKAMLDEELNAIRAELQSARTQSEQAQVEARSIVERAQTVLTHVEASRSRFAEMEKKYHEQIEDLERRVAQYSASTPSSSGADDASLIQSIRQEYEEQRRIVEAQLAAAKNEARAAVKARDDTIERLDQMTAVYASLEIDFEQARGELESRRIELEALRHEAAAQVAAANAQAGDIEHEYARLLSGADLSRQTSQIVVAGLQTLRQQLAEQAQSVERLVAKLIETADRAEGDLSRAPAARSGNGRSNIEADSPDLFEAFGDAPVSLPADNATKIAEETNVAAFDLDAVIRAQAAFDLHKSPSGS